MSLSHILVVAALVVLLFGRGKVSELLGDLGKGIRSFKKGIAEDSDDPSRSASENSHDGNGTLDVVRKETGEHA